MIDAATPEIVLKDWTRGTRSIATKNYDVISFKTVANAGKSSALHVHINATELLRTPPLTSLSTIQIPIIPINQEVNVNGEITIFWENNNKEPFATIGLKIYCWSAKGVRYETIYSLIAAEPTNNMLQFGGGEAAK